MKHIDLRSDTVTLPTPAMREAMYRAEVGDDGHGEDPTVNRLQEIAALRMGKEDAVFVASGTQGNLVSLLTHCRSGDEAIVGDQSHVLLYEVGGMSALAGVLPRALLTGPDGTIDLGAVEAAVRPDDKHMPRTRLICLENTHNQCGGVAITPEYTESLCALARRHGLAVHLDGARIFNAAVALGVDVSALTKDVDSVMFCLSKGLSAPVGSLLCGSRAFIAEARRNRQMVGGGMRQAGIVAAAGIVALDQMVDRLHEDHANARLLGEGLNGVKGLSVDMETVQTNIVRFQVTAKGMTPDGFMAELKREGVQILGLGGSLFRAVTHYGIEEDDIKEAIGAFGRVMEA